MLTVTESAKQQLRELLLSHSDDPEVGVRLTMGGPGQIGLTLDREKLDDHVVEYEGSKVLLFGPEVVNLVAEATLDTHDTPEGVRLVISKR